MWSILKKIKNFYPSKNTAKIMKRQQPRENYLHITYANRYLYLEYIQNSYNFTTKKPNVIKT